MPTLVADVGAANANSYETLAEANVYFDARIPLKPVWIASGDAAIRQLLTATRVLDSLNVPQRVRYRDKDGKIYYVVARQWTGLPATTTQALAWPRVGMLDRLGRAIPSNVIPQELKDAESELAGQLGKADRTLDNDVAVQGITSVKAGSVAVTFKDSGIETKVLPDAVLNLMPPSWFTEETVEYPGGVMFEVL
jgi:hypothetical protein